jgi:hypothetical protein
MTGCPPMRSVVSGGALVGLLMLGKGPEGAAEHRRGSRCVPKALVLGTLVLTLVGPIPPIAPVPAEAKPATEAGRKSEMLYYIAKFIRWPDASFTASRGQIIFAIVGEDELAGTLANMLSTRSVNGRPVFVRFIRRAQDIQGCHILFISRSEELRVAELLRAAQNLSVLTVADSHGFVAAGGMVDFVMVNDHVRFEIAPNRAEQVGLKISAKLLALAHVVEEAH